MKHSIIAFVAGKSGGHILPCLHLAQEKKNLNSNTTIIFFSTRRSLDKKIIQQHSAVSKHISLALEALPSGVLQYPLFFWYILLSFFTSLITYIDHQPDEIITTGGIVAIPPVVAAWIMRIPIHVYVLDIKPGKAIRFLKPFSSRISYCFAHTVKYLPAKKSELCTYPLGYTATDYAKSSAAARLTLGLDPHKKTLCILGGSQGSLFINDLIVQWISNSQSSLSSLQIIHQTGQQDSRPWHTIYPKHSIPAYVFDYRHNLANIYAAADLIICRAGAGTLFEVQAFGKKAIVIPLETATNTHQIDNATGIVAQFPAQFKIMRQKHITENPSRFFSDLEHLLGYSADQTTDTSFSHSIERQ